MELRIAGMTKESVVDGPGLRFVVFAQGCPHKCFGCHNPQTIEDDGGRVIDTEEILREVSRVKLIRGVTFSGGEPFMQPAPLALLAREFRAQGLDIVTYTGFTFEQLVKMAIRSRAVRQLLAYTDILVDGPFKAAERDLGLAFRGSRNQRLINVPQSLALGRVVLWEDEPETIRRWA